MIDNTLVKVRFPEKKAVFQEDDQRQSFWVQLMITNRCNLHCKLCNICREKGKRSVDLAKAKFVVAQVLRKMTSIGCFSITGGEPFLEQRNIAALTKTLFPLIALRRIKVFNISTNGTLYDEIGVFANSVPSDIKRWVTFNISLDGLSLAHNFLRGEGTFDKVIKSIILLKAGGFEVTANFVISPFNCQEIYSLYLLAKKVGFKVEYNVFSEYTRSFYHYSQRLLMPNGGFKDWQARAIKKINKVIEDGAVNCRIKQLLYIRSFFSSGRIPRTLTQNCQRPSKIIFIRATGEIYSCFYAKPISHLDFFSWDAFIEKRNALISAIASYGCRRCLLGSLKYVK